MTEMRKITAFVPSDVLANAQKATGAGISETLRLGLERLAREHFYQLMRGLRGKVKLDIDLDELREDREFDEHGNVIR